MPQIQEYLPEVEAQGPVGGVSPNVELAGATGRGMEQLGGALAQSADIIHRRQAQAETADIYASFADKRAEYTNQIQKQVSDGTLDVDKLKQQYDEDTQKLADKIDTPEGRNFFNRQQARLKGHLVHMAATGQAVVARNDALGAWNDGVTQTSNAVQLDPLSFHDAYEAGLESIDELIKNGGLPEKMRAKAVQQMGSQYSRAAIRGIAEDHPEEARQMIDAGAYDQFLNSDQKHAMMQEVHSYARAKDAENDRTKKVMEDAQKAAAEKWGQDSLPKLASNSLSSKEVLGAVRDGTLKWEQGERWLQMIKTGAKEESKTDPRVKNALIDRIVNPESQNPIMSAEEIMPYVGHGVSISDFNQMNGLIDKTPEGSVTKQGTKALFQAAKSIKFKNMLTGQYDVAGEKKLAQFMSDYAQAKKDVKAAGGNPADLVNPSSPLYFGNKISDYQTPIGEQYSQSAQDQRGKALGLTPTTTNPNPTPVKGAREKGEKAADYLKRTGR